MKRPNQTVYNVIPSQQTMWLMIKYSPHKNVLQIPTSVTLGQNIDFGVLTKALNIEIERNDCMRLRFFKEKGDLKQYFLPEYKVDFVPVKSFKTEEEQNEYFNMKAKKAVNFLKGENFHIEFFHSFDGGCGIFFNVNHFVMDANAVSVFYMDLLSVYKALMTGEEMPKKLFKFEDYIIKELAQLEDKENYAKGAEFYKEYFSKDGPCFYAGVHGPELLMKEREKTKNPNLRVPHSAYNPFDDKSDMIELHIDREISEKIINFCKENLIPPEILFQMGYRTHVSQLNFRTDDTLSMQLCSKRVTFKEKRMGGCVTQPLQVRCIIKEENTFREGLDIINGVRNSLFRHMDFPYLAARGIQMKLFGYGLTDAPSFMMYTWLPVPTELPGGIKFTYKGYNMGRYCMPLYTFTYPAADGMNFNYLYRISKISKQNIYDLHNNMLKTILAGIENPDLTFGELMDSCTE